MSIRGTTRATSGTVGRGSSSAFASYFPDARSGGIPTTRILRDPNPPPLLPLPTGPHRQTGSRQGSSRKHPTRDAYRCKSHPARGQAPTEGHSGSRRGLRYQPRDRPAGGGVEVVAMSRNQSWRRHPNRAAKAQGKQAYSLRMHGLTLPEIAMEMGVSRDTASDLVRYGKRWHMEDGSCPYCGKVMASDDPRYHVAQQSTSDPAGKVTGRES